MVPTKELQAFRTSTRGITCHKINPPAPPPGVAALMTLDYNVLLARASTSTGNLFFFFAGDGGRKRGLEAEDPLDPSFVLLPLDKRGRFRHFLAHLRIPNPAAHQD